MSAIESSAPVVLVDREPAVFSVRRMGERMAVVDAGESLDERSARRFARTVLQATAEGVRELVLDFSRVHEHAWPAVYALCELEARLSEACCEPVAAAVNPALVDDLRAVGLDHAWSLSATLSDALADLLGRAPVR